MAPSRRVVGIIVLCLAAAGGLVACSGGPGSPSTLPDQSDTDASAGDSGPNPPREEDCSNAGCALPPRCNPDGTPGPRPRCPCSCSEGDIVDGMLCTDRGCLVPLPDAGDDASDGG